MTEPYALQSFNGASPTEIEDTLEKSEVVFFKECPIELPTEADLEFLRDGLPPQTKTKNVSYHPESDSVPRFEASEEIHGRVTKILKDHRQAVTDYLKKTIPNLAPGWTAGTSSFRALEEKGRKLKPRSSNEIIHIDAGAYGATCGNRILRFFVNVSPDVDRVWGTKGNFSSLFRQYEEFSEAAKGKGDKIRVSKRPLDRCYSGLVSAISKGYPLAKVIDSSPYDRAMRRIHNYMKESEQFRGDATNYRELRFPPLSAWMVFTDSTSHSVISGQYALVTTVLIPLENCRRAELTPYHILKAAGETPESHAA